MRIGNINVGNNTLHTLIERNAIPTGVDFLVVCMSYVVLIYARTLDFSSDYLTNFGFVIFAACVMVLLLHVFGVYKRIWSQTSGHGSIVIINAVTFATLIIVFVAVVTQQRPLPLSVILMGNLLSLVGFIAVRYRSRLVSGLEWRWRVIWRSELPVPRTRVLIIGAGESGQVLALRLKHRLPGSHYQVVGFIDDDPSKQDMYVEGCRVLGTRDDIVAAATRHKVDLIAVALHNVSGPDFREILSSCESTQALIKVVPDLAALVSAKQTKSLLRDVQIEDYIGRSVISHHEAIDFAPITNKVILVTGAAGSIGSELSRQITAHSPTKLVLLDNNESGLHDLITELSTKLPALTIVPALIDIKNPTLLRSLFIDHRPQVVFHAAAYKHVPMLERYPQQALEVNIRGTINVAELALTYGVERFVLISTDKAVKPSSVMGASKRVCELMLHALSQSHASDTSFTAVRFGNVLGSRGSVVPTFDRQIDEGGPVTVTHEDMTRYFMSIPEAVNLILHAVCLTQGDDIYVLQMGEVVRIVELAERMIRMRGLRPYRDIDIKFTGMRPGEKMHEELFNELERPVKTNHPYIVKIEGWDPEFDVLLFMERLSKLTDGLSSEEVLSLLHDAIESRSVGAVVRTA